MIDYDDYNSHERVDYDLDFSIMTHYHQLCSSKVIISLIITQK